MTRVGDGPAAPRAPQAAQAPRGSPVAPGVSAGLLLAFAGTNPAAVLQSVLAFVDNTNELSSEDVAHIAKHLPRGVRLGTNQKGRLHDEFIALQVHGLEPGTTRKFWTQGYPFPNDNTGRGWLALDVQILRRACDKLPTTLGDSTLRRLEQDVRASLHASVSWKRFTDVTQASFDSLFAALLAKPRLRRQAGEVEAAARQNPEQAAAVIAGALPEERERLLALVGDQALRTLGQSLAPGGRYDDVRRSIAERYSVHHDIELEGCPKERAAMTTVLDAMLPPASQRGLASSKRLRVVARPVGLRVTDLPESKLHAHPPDSPSWLGAVISNPGSTDAVLLRRDGDKAAPSWLATHEVAHAARWLLTKAQHEALQACYDKAIKDGARPLNGNASARATVGEYWAEASQAYFGVGRFNSTRAWIEANEPELYGLLKHVYGEPREAAATVLGQEGDSSTDRLA